MRDNLVKLRILIAEPLPCRYFQDAEKTCTCSPAVVARYQKRISSSLLGRIDIHVDVPRVNYEKLSGQQLGEPSHAVRERVAAARAMQAGRFKGTRLLTNADMGPAPDAGRDAAIAPLGTRLPPRAQAGPHHRRPDGCARERPRPLGRGDPVSAEEGGVAGMSS